VGCRPLIIDNTGLNKVVTFLAKDSVVVMVTSAPSDVNVNPQVRILEIPDSRLLRKEVDAMWDSVFCVKNEYQETDGLGGGGLTITIKT